MAQLRQDYGDFLARDAEIVVVGPDDRRAFQDYWREKELPFVGLAVPTHTVARRYGQIVRLLKLGRMPALMVIDKAGQVAYTHFGGSMQDIPPNGEILTVLDELHARAQRDQR